LGTDKHNHGVDQLAGKDGDDEIRGLGGQDYIYGGPGRDMIFGGPGDDEGVFGQEGEDVIYGGPGDDLELLGAGDGRRDEIYCGKGMDTYTADKVDYVDSSCEKKTQATSAMA
jgi:Ca2+-binding RTX toxin-like protein